MKNDNSQAVTDIMLLVFGNSLDGKIPKIPLILFIPGLLNPFNPVHPGAIYLAELA